MLQEFWSKLEIGKNNKTNNNNTNNNNNNLSKSTIL